MLEAWTAITLIFSGAERRHSSTFMHSTHINGWQYLTHSSSNSLNRITYCSAELSWRQMGIGIGAKFEMLLLSVHLNERCTDSEFTSCNAITYYLRARECQCWVLSYLATYLFRLVWFGERTYIASFSIANFASHLAEGGLERVCVCVCVAFKSK